MIGIAVLAKLQLAALRRARLPQRERIPFYLYVDEFQNFATPSFTQMLSEARKYKLFLTMAEQSTSQQDDYRMVDVILANVGTVISFRSGNPSDEKKLLPYFKPYLEEGDIASLPSFNFYIRISAVKIQEAFSGETLVPTPNRDVERSKLIIDLSRQNYAVKFNTDQPAPKVKRVRAKSTKSVRKATLKTPN